MHRWFLMFFLTASSVYGQDVASFTPADTTGNALFSSGDSLSIFNLIDSLLQLDDALGSQLALRVSYNSNVLSAGRTLGIKNFGLAPGISYYHKSGLYADLAGYWSKDFDPSYYLTVASFGYMHDLSKKFSIMASYDRYFYAIADEESYIPYKNTLSVTPILEFKPFSISGNYAFYFGEQHAHRIMPGLSVMLEKKNLWRIDRISVMPSFFALWGNETITTLEFVAPKTILEAIRNRRMYGTRFSVVETTRNVFGIMNYAISIPLSISYKNWGVSFSYTYNIPKALPGEPPTLSESTYLSGSLYYLIDLKRQKNLW